MYKWKGDLCVIETRCEGEGDVDVDLGGRDSHTVLIVDYSGSIHKDDVTGNVGSMYKDDLLSDVSRMSNDWVVTLSKYN